MFIDGKSKKLKESTNKDNVTKDKEGNNKGRKKSEIKRTENFPFDSSD